MTENEAIRELKWAKNSLMASSHMDKDKDVCFSIAIKALVEVQQYRALEKHLSDMFGGSLSLKMCVDELERILTEPDSPHPMNAKILTYQEAADWEDYRAIGTVEECRAAMEKQIPKKPVKNEKQGIRYTDFYECPTCHKGFTGTGIADYCYHCGQAIDWE